MSERRHLQRKKEPDHQPAPSPLQLSRTQVPGPVAKQGPTPDIADAEKVESQESVAPRPDVQVGGHDYSRLNVIGQAPVPPVPPVDPPGDGLLEVAEHSAGSALRSDLRERFERSLGTDLSAVRVHVGTASGRAAKALEADAFTIGTDIHLAAGTHAPGDPQADRLLAHEVAHTVQSPEGWRAGDGALTVSQPQDALEQDADRAAEALTVGAPFTLAAAGAASGPYILRKTAVAKRGPAEELRQAAVDAEKEDKATGMGSSLGANMAVLSATNVGDVTAAEEEIKKIRGAEDKLREGMKATFSGVDGALLGENQSALNELSAYVAEAGVQTSSMSNFQQQYQRLMMDYDRLNHMVAVVGVNAETGGKQFAQSLVDSQKLGAADKAKMSADTDDPNKIASGPLKTAKAEVRLWQDKMQSAAADLGVKEKTMTGKAHGYMAAGNDIAAGLQPRDVPEAVTAYKDLQAKVEKIKGYAKTVTGWATKALGGYLGTAASGAVGGMISAADKDLQGGLGVTALQGKDKAWAEKAGKLAEDKVPDFAQEFVGYVATIPWQGDLNEASGLAKKALEEQQFEAKQQQINKMKEKKEELEAAALDYLKTAGELQRAKNMVRRTMMEMGRIADRSGGGRGQKWQTLATFLGEAEAYLAQSQATMAVGENEKQLGADVQQRREGITVKMGPGEVHWWTARQEKMVASDKERWVTEKHLVRLPVGAAGKSAAGMMGDTEGGANAVIEYEMQRLKGHQEWMAGMKDRLAAEFAGFGSDV